MLTSKHRPSNIKHFLVHGVFQTLVQGCPDATELLLRVALIVATLAM